MADPTPTGYDVFLFPNAVDALGDPIKPYLEDGPDGQHIGCKDVDTGGVLIEMMLEVPTEGGAPMQVELMIPSNMVRMIVSKRGDRGTFGFGRGPTGGKH